MPGLPVGSAPCAVSASDVTGNIDAGDGSGAPAKSAKSEIGQSLFNGYCTSFVIIPSSVAGSGCDPPNRPLI